MDFLWDDEVSEQDYIAGMQELVNTGQAWYLEGSVGRQAMSLIESGQIMLGEEGHRDYWGNYVPSRYEVEAGSMGSAEFVKANNV